jgi:hypothetical protein
MCVHLSGVAFATQQSESSPQEKTALGEAQKGQGSQDLCPFSFFSTKIEKVPIVPKMKGIV